MNEKTSSNLKKYSFLLIVIVGIIYFFSNPKPQTHYDYTFRVADNFLRGAIGFNEKPPSWLNEFVPFGESWYSVFPLGSILTMIPFAFFKFIGAIKEMPAGLISALTASGITWCRSKRSVNAEFEIRNSCVLRYCLGRMFVEFIAL